MDLFSSHIVSTTHQISLCRSFKYNCFRTSYSFIIFLAQSLSLGFIASSVQYVSIIRSLRLALWLDSFSSLFPVSHQLDRSLRLATCASISLSQSLLCSHLFRAESNEIQEFLKNVKNLSQSEQTLFSNVCRDLHQNKPSVGIDNTSLLYRAAKHKIVSPLLVVDRLVF